MPSTVCIIPARGGSVRIPRKNIKPFAGQPMLVHAINKARATRLFDEILVSTDDDEIATVAERHCAHLHYRNTDDGSRGTQQLAADILGPKDASIACALYPCTPLLTVEELIMGWRLLVTASQGCPLFVHSMSDDKGTDAGGYYWGFAFAFVRGIALESSRIGVQVQHHRDINTPADWDDAERRYLALQPQGRPS